MRSQSSLCQPPKFVSLKITIIMMTLGLTISVGGQSELTRATQEEKSDEPRKTMPAPEHQKVHTARLAKNTRYNGGVCDLLTKTVDQLCIDQVWPRALPVIPLRESDFALLGQVENLKPYLSADRTHIYTEITLKIEEAFKSPLNSKIPNGRSLVIDQIGGAITLPSGQVVHDSTRVDFLGRTHVGVRYALFAKRIHDGKDLSL